MAEGGDITLLLRRAAAGDAVAFEQAVGRVYGELERRAGQHLRREFGRAANDVTLEPSALTNETFLRLVDQRNAFENRRHFFAIANQVMLRVMLDYHGARKAKKRPAGKLRVTLGALDRAARRPSTEVPDLLEALERLEELDARKAEVVKLRGLWGLEIAEIAATLGVSPTTIERDWRFARNWLAHELRG